MRRVCLLVASMSLLSCGGEGLADGESVDPAEGAGEEGLGLVVEGADGSKRVPYLDGAFVTRAREMPIEVEQAVMGLPTDRPVLVWAGLDVAPVSNPTER